MHGRRAPKQTPQHQLLEGLAIELLDGGVVCDGDASQQNRARAVCLRGEQRGQRYCVGRAQ